jgi:hypothetical protein
MSARPQDQPVFRSSTPGLRGPEASGGHPHRPYISEATWLSVYLPPGSARPAPGKRASNESRIKNSIAVTQLDILRGSGGATFVPMMQPTHLWDRDDPPGFWCLDRA